MLAETLELEAAKAAVLWSEGLAEEGYGAEELSAHYGAVVGEIWVKVGAGLTARLFKVRAYEHKSAHGVLEGVGYGVSPAALPH